MTGSNRVRAVKEYLRGLIRKQVQVGCVVLGQLCGLREPNHSPGCCLLGRVLPDWRECNKKLNAFQFGYAASAWRSSQTARRRSHQFS